MAKTLTVILGAGSSHDCVSEGVTEYNEAYRPPLTKHLFAFKPSFNTILKNYPRAEGLSDEIRTRVKAGEGLEEILKELEDREDLFQMRQFQEIALYFQELLGEVGSKFVVSGGTKFHTLVNALTSSAFEKVMFLTLNYDVLLERALEVQAGVRFVGLSTYSTKGGRWSLVKVHGSVNWGRQIAWPDGARNSTEFIQSLTAKPTFHPEIVLLKDHTENSRLINGKLCYPVVAVPMGPSKQPVCPPKHIQFAEEFLGECRSFLVIGFSALDKDVLSLLQRVQNVERLYIINGSFESASETLQRIADANQRFGALPGSRLNTCSNVGFAEFVDNGGLKRFLSS